MSPHPAPTSSRISTHCRPSQQPSAKAGKTHDTAYEKCWISPIAKANYVNTPVGSKEQHSQPKTDPTDIDQLLDNRPPGEPLGARGRHSLLSACRCWRLGHWRERSSPADCSAPLKRCSAHACLIQGKVSLPHPYVGRSVMRILLDHLPVPGNCVLILTCYLIGRAALEMDIRRHTAFAVCGGTVQSLLTVNGCLSRGRPLLPPSFPVALSAIR